MQVRKFQEGDLEQIMEIDYMMWLQLQWNESFQKESFFVVEKNKQLLGVAALAYDGTWYYLDRDVDYIPKYRMNIHFAIKEECKQKNDVKALLIQALKIHFQQVKKAYPDKSLAIRLWSDSTDIEEIQTMLDQGFIIEDTMLVLAFDLNQEVPSFRVPDEVKIGIHDFESDGMKQYLKANALGYDNVQDSEGELRFRLQGEKTKVFTAMVGEEVVASTTVWELGNGRSASENVFTIPQYQRKKIGAETLCTALRYLQKEGEKEANLTVYGGNYPALQMYLKIGYKLQYHLMEMHYTL